MQRRSFVKAGITSALAAGLVGRPHGAQPPGGVPANTVLVPQRAVRWADFLGVNAHFLWFEPRLWAQQIAQLKALGLKWVRVDLHWDRLEPQPGQYQLGLLDALVQTLAQANLQAVVYLVGSAPFASSAPPDAPFRDQYPPRDPAAYAQRLAMLAQRYPQVAAWQVWNEPNIAPYWRPHEDAAGYGALLQASTRALRLAAPGKLVVMGGMAYYSQMPVQGGLMLEALGQAGAFGLGTVAAYHPYTEFPQGDDPHAQDYLLHASLLNARLRGAGVKDIWATEWGWSSYAGPQEMQAIIGEAGQADYLLRRLAIMATQDFDRIFLFALSNLDARASVRDRSYGLLRLDATAKPAYQALQRFLAVMGDAVVPAQPLPIAADQGGMYCVTWQAKQRRLLLFWSAQPGTATISGPMHGVLHDPLSGRSQAVAAENGSLRVPIQTSLQILEVA